MNPILKSLRVKRIMLAVKCRGHSPGFVGSVKYGLESDNLLNMLLVQGRC